tara:strand:- start:372 stop:1319 length:948 start_codon:yes stop_codon:yes gene_type:complete
MNTEKIYQGNCIEVLKDFSDESIDCVVTSPPYWGLRDYNEEEQLGLEKTPEEFVANLVKVFSEVKRVLKKEGTVWLNLGDSYFSAPAGNKDGIPKQNAYGGREDAAKSMFKASQVKGKKHNTLKLKDLIGIPWRVALALQSDGWYLRQDIIWHKPNPMPESVQDRCTKSHEYIFLLTKSPKYFYDIDAIKEKAVGERWGGNKPININNSKDKKNIHNGLTRERKIEFEMKNKRSVWKITTKPYKEAHFATFPMELPITCIKAGCPEGGIVLDPFFGSGTTGLAAQELNRHWVGIELNPEYIEIAKKRTSQTTLFV